MMCVGLALMGFTYGPLGTLVSELFPTEVRYTGSSVAFSVAGILGASLAPYIATWLAKHFGLQFVGYYLSGSAILTFIGLLLIRETSGYDRLPRTRIGRCGEIRASSSRRSERIDGEGPATRP